MIITLTQLKDYLGITGSAQDTKLQFIVDGVNAQINKDTGRTWGESVTVVDEKHDYKPVVFLNNVDVSDVTTVKRYRGSEETTLDADNYFWNEYGRLVLNTSGEDFVQNVDHYDELQVTYDYGFVTPPNDLLLAALQLGGDMQRALGGEVSEESVGSFRKKYTATTTTARDIIDSYRIRKL